MYLEHGCQLTKVLKNGWTVLHFACYYAKGAVIIVLLEAEITDIDANAVDTAGQSARNILEDRRSKFDPDYSIHDAEYEFLDKLMRNAKER